MPLRKTPQISQLSPQAAIPGGELHFRGKNFGGEPRPTIAFGESAGHLVVGSDSLLIVKVPDGVEERQVTVGQNGSASAPFPCAVGVQLTDGVHPVSNPAVDRDGMIYATLSGSRGQKTPVSVFRVDPHTRQAAPFVGDIVNATGLAFDGAGMLYVSSRQEGSVYRVTPGGNSSVFVEGMGIATGIAFDAVGNLYVGDRSGTIFKVSTERQIYVFATLEQSYAAYHLAFGPDGYLYVTGPTTSSFDAVHRIAASGEVEMFYRGLGRPQGIAFDAAGNLYVAASLAGRRGIVRVTQDRNAELFLTGPGIVGLAFAPAREMVVATHTAVFRVAVDVEGRRLP